MTNWPSAGTVRDVPSERNLRILRKRGGELERELRLIEEKGLPPTGKVGGVLKGELPNPEFAKEPAYKAELENETTARKEVDGILKGEGETEKASREAAVKAEKEARESADATEKTKREEAITAEKSARETADNERVKGPASATESDIATYNGATGKVVKDSGKTIASVLLEAEETAKALASAAAAGLSIKNPVAYATTADISAKVVTEKTIESTSKLEVDGELGFEEGTRLLLKNQILPAQNGIWTVTEDRSVGGSGKVGGGGKVGEGSGYLLTRAVDADTTEEVKQGMFVLVTNGTTNKATAWILTTADPIVIGTTAEEFSAFTVAPTGVAGGDLEGTYPEPQIKAKVIVNGDVSDTAAVEYKKLNLAGKILGSDIAEKTVEDSDLTSPNNAAYREIGWGQMLIVTDAGAGTFILNPDINANGASPMQVYPAGHTPRTIWLDSEDFAVASKTTKLRVRGMVYTNGTAPAQSFTFGLYPVAWSGAADVLTATLGAVVASSTAAVSSLSANAAKVAVSSEFSMPATGAYALGVVTNGTLTNNAAVLTQAVLQMHSV